MRCHARASRLAPKRLQSVLHVGNGAAQRLGATWRIMLSTSRFSNTCMPQPLCTAPAPRMWGAFDHVGCRGDTTEAKDVLGGSGFVTNVHITDRLVQVGEKKAEKKGGKGEEEERGRGGQSGAVMARTPINRRRAR